MKRKNKGEDDEKIMFNEQMINEIVNHVLS